ncbi:MAG: 6-carboxytetrahydropterin synthase, partial [Treponemataceae bacterium]|nr:6-carboxytetrahydropterin synthase [Treponemataceae bacterium]
MYEVRVETDFSAAHFLRDYNGKCENLHGHNYKVFAHVRGKNLNEGGMLLDFSKLKSALKKVCAALDHTNLNDIEFFDQNPSA